MIVEPDFPDHWKVQALVDRLESEEAVRCLLRLWANCQARRTDEFEFWPSQLKSLCRWSGDAAKFWEAMTHPDEGWLEDMGPVTVEQSATSGRVPRGTWWRVRGWKTANSTLFANWKRNPSGKNKNDTLAGKSTWQEKGAGVPHGPPTGPPRGTPRAPHGGGAGVPDREDRRDREEEIEGMDTGAGAPGGAPPIEFPHGFPESAEQAVAWVRGSMVCGDAPDDWIRTVWEQAVGRGCKDAAGALIERFTFWVASRWSKERDRWLLEYPPAKKKEAAPANMEAAAIVPAAFPWRTLSRMETGFDPQESWERQTARFRNDMRALWASLSEERRSEIVAASEKEGGAA